MAEVSRNVVAGLLALVVIVSGFSMYYALWGTHEQPALQEGGSSGEIKLTIVPYGDQAEQQSATQGRVVLEIVQPTQ